MVLELLTLTDIFHALQVLDVNVNGVLFTAQAAGQQMERFGNGGSIVLIASMSGSITNQVYLRFTKHHHEHALILCIGPSMGVL